MGAKRIIEVSLRIAWKDLKELERNKLGLLMLILMPLLMMAMIGYIYPSGAQIDMSNLKVQVVNLDTGYLNIDASETFASAVNQINSMSVNMQFSNGTTIDALTDSIQRGDTDAGIIIPSNFTQCILNNQQANITIISDNSNPQVSTQVSSVLTGIIESMSKQITQSNLVAQLNITPQEAASYMAPYTVNDQGVVGESSSYFQFIAPGMMMMTVMMSVMTGLPGAITMERELGTLDGVMVAPINRLSIILGKTLAQLARGLLQGFIILLLAVTLFGVTIHGSLLLVVGLLLLGVFSFVGLGITLTSVAKDQETATMIMMTTMFPMMFLSGIFFPVKMMPSFMQTISSFLPLTYASNAMRKVMVLGAGIPQIATELIVLIVFGAVLLAIAVPLFKRMMTR